MLEPDFVINTRTSYDTIADGYATQFKDEFQRYPLHRALLTWFAELVGDGPVLDVGCGPGRTTGLLHSLGVDVAGVDLSPGFLAIARAENPGIRFTEGTMLALDQKPGSLAGLLANYSLIHVPDEALSEILAGFHRALRNGGYLWVAHQVGDEPRHMTEAYGQEIDLVFRRRQPDFLAAALSAAGFELRLRVVREPEDGELTPHTILVARKRPDSDVL
ncbi:methyltransferase [Asanoa ishikariensis]|uniref:Methyltransferase domain-containing protein n=1 Tax=Asanoa ishikariensis TaxID=137265 RepID=A0A1H3P2U3_9ACTN|nr:class I SAM-dependent methyltransferase [Asanoa ishikariensis]GIF68160.1 methyltransferase [Asanoa ishikariensis]SDY95371.1 Methyltransferase domain-containing protein [Asanoa ishikariensis]